MSVNAKIICHSKAPNGEELITFEIELHRFVLPEFNTHRVCSRNFQSSRAVPTNKLLEQIRNFPAMPVFWGENQPGMIADNELTGLRRDQCEDLWLNAAKQMASIAEEMNDLGCHKQITNRLLEPFMWTKGVVTVTREACEGFFKLRSHYAAQPEIKALSDAMKEALETSEPRELGYNEYHLPYITWFEDDEGVHYLSNVGDGQFLELTIEEAIKVSTSCCAQVSYRVLDGSLDKAIKIYKMLHLPENGVYPDDPPHFSPTEHIAKVGTVFREESGNFASDIFWQYRKALEEGNELLFIEE